ncbi:MAG: hypothetical protein MET45_21770 [Nostoc sp. LLA-1]|nr:hypothetical protein [Cyanocohniella sp. LLY]
MKKLYSAAHCRLSPVNKEKEMVIPLRLKPGINANACPKPMTTATQGFKALNPHVWRIFLSVHQSKIPVMLKVKQMAKG